MEPTPEALVIPGFVAINPGRWSGSGRAEIVRGPLAGKATLPDLTDWKREIWLLTREAAARRGIAIPSERAELAAFPRLRARLAEAALVVVDGAQLGALGAGDTLIFLAYHRVSAGGGLEVHTPDGTRGFSGDDASLDEVIRGQDDAQLDAFPDIASVYDRTLRALTGGALSLYDVDLALWADSLAPSGFAAFEAELTEIEAMAAERRPLAESLVAALAAADADEVLLPGGYRARRRREPAFVLRQSAGLSVINGPLKVPAAERWFVAEVQAFMPPSRQARRQQQFAQVRREEGRRAAQAYLLLALSLVVLILLVALNAC